MNKILITVVVLLVIVVLGYYFINQPAEVPGQEVLNYSSPTLNFIYPADYKVKESSDGLVLTVPQEVPVNGEGPTAITVNTYDVASTTAIADWVQQEPVSNFNLSIDGQLEIFPFGQYEAVTYTWDGLYRGDAVALSTGTKVYLFSVTYLDPSDEIRRHFYSLLETVDILE